MDLTLSTSLEFNTPLADLSDVKTMMDSINVVPGLTHTAPLSLCFIREGQRRKDKSGVGCNI